MPSVSNFDKNSGEYYQRAICLVRLHSQPLGIIELKLEEHGLHADEYAPYIWQSFAKKINEHLRNDGLLPVNGLDITGLSNSTTPACFED